MLILNTQRLCISALDEHNLKLSIINFNKMEKKIIPNHYLQKYRH